jgi:ABC-type glycerol-3-phosphate transport system substrate-binding protein
MIKARAQETTRWARSRRFSAAGLAAATLFAVTGGVVAQNASASSKQVVTFWEFQTDTPSINAFKASISSFETSHPGITVQMSIVPWSEQAQKLTTGLATGALPDVSMLGNDIVAEFVAEHELLPINLSDTADITPGDKLYYHLGGQWYGVPLVDETRGLIYNKAIFKAAGITTAPSTFAQLFADAQAIKAKTGSIPIVLPEAKNVYNTVQNFMSFYLGYGAHYLNANGSCGFDTPQFMKALTLYASFYKDGLDSPDAAVDPESTLEAIFTAGQAGMIIDGPSFYYELEATNPTLFKELGVVPIPAGPAGRFGFDGGWPLVVWKSAASGGVQNAAEEFAEYVGTGGGGDIALAKATGLIPANISAAKEAPWNSGYLSVFTKQVSNDAYPYQYPAPEIPQMGALETDTVQTAVQSVALGTSTVQSATSTLCAAVNTATGK